VREFPFFFFAFSPVYGELFNDIFSVIEFSARSINCEKEARTTKIIEPKNKAEFTNVGHSIRNQSKLRILGTQLIVFLVYFCSFHRFLCKLPSELEIELEHGERSLQGEQKLPRHRCSRAKRF
jgi:hypothetical protein